VAYRSEHDWHLVAVRRPQLAPLILIIVALVGVSVVGVGSELALRTAIEGDALGGAVTLSFALGSVSLLAFGAWRTVRSRIEIYEEGFRYAHAGKRGEVAWRDVTRVQGRDGVVDSGAAYVVYVGDVRHEVPALFLPSDLARATDRTVEPG
jgi:hypothetical protein